MKRKNYPTTRGAGKGFLLLCLMGFSHRAMSQTHELQWIKTMGNSTNDMGRYVRTDPSGNIYCSGTFTGTVDFDPGAGVSNLTAALTTGSTFLSKSDTAGNLLWVRMIDGGAKMAFDAAGNIYLTANFTTATTDADPGAGTNTLTRKGTGDAYVLKLDPSGNFVWAKQFGGSMQTTLYGLSVDAGGNVCATGYYTGTTDFDPGTGVSNLSTKGSGSNPFVVKLDKSGNLVWAKAFESSITAAGGAGIQITNDAAGNVFVTGSLHDTIDFDPGAGTKNLISAGLADVFVTKLDASGNLAWAKRIGGPEPDWAFALAVDKGGNVYATGTIDGTANFDPGGTDYSIPTGGGASGSPDVFLAKFNSSGNFIWAKGYGGTLNESAGGIAIDDAGDLYLAGSFWGTVNFNTGSTGPFNLIAASTYDGFILKLDPNGIFYWVKQVRSENNSSRAEVASLNIDPSGNIVATGGYSGTVDFEPSGAKVLDLTAAGQNDIFLMKLKLNTVHVTESAVTPRARVYPNPAKNTLEIAFDEPVSDAYISFFDLSGKCAWQQKPVSGNTLTIDISILAAGTYYMQLSAKNFTDVQLIRKL